MAIFRCNKCGYLREVPNQHTCKKVKCPVCKQIMPIYGTLAFVKKLLDKYFSVRTELSRLQKSLPATEISDEADDANQNADDMDIFNTTAMTEKQQYQPILDWFKSQSIQLDIFSFPRAGVGTQSGRASVQCIITERKEPWKFSFYTRRFCYETAFPRRRVGTRKNATQFETLRKYFQSDLKVVFSINHFKLTKWILLC